MNEKDDDRDEHKQSTQAIAEQPQEEFVAQENIPSKTEAEVSEERSPKNPEPPRH